MGDGKKKGGSKLGLVLVLLLAGLLVSGAVGYFRPNTPLLGPLVGMVVKQASLARDTGGIYEVRISELRLADEEFSAGEALDLQVLVFAVDAQGNLSKEPLFDTRKFGDRLAEAGNREKPVVARWPDHTFRVDWKQGDEFLVQVWDRKGSDTLLSEWRSEKSSGFPLSGQIAFTVVNKADAKNPKGNYIKFDAAPTTAK